MATSAKERCVGLGLSLKNRNGDTFQAIALEPRMQSLLETATSKSVYTLMTITLAMKASTYSPA